MEPVQVECYSGYTYAQEPRSIIRRGVRIGVMRVIKTWRTPDGPGFRVRLDDGALVELYFDEQRGQWLLGEQLPTPS